MTQTPLSADQQQAFDTLQALMLDCGVDLASHQIMPRKVGRQIMVILGKAGSGKTLLLARIAQLLNAAGVETISDEYEPKDAKRSLAILAPTNKAASVLRNRSIPASTIHRILYRPLYDPDYEKIAEWLAGNTKRPTLEKIEDSVLDRAQQFYQNYKSIPAALAAAGLRGSDFIEGWQKRNDHLDIALVDEASMLDDEAIVDLSDIFPTLILFGDPAQLAPVGQNDGAMAFDKLPNAKRCELVQIHRQQQDNPIINLAHALGDETLDFSGFEALVKQAASRDPRVQVVRSVNCDLMARSPVLVWRNQTRVRLIHAFRTAHNAPLDGLLAGEPLICDGIELPARHRKKRLDLELRGLIKGAQVIFLGNGKKPGFSRLHVLDAQAPQLSAASIIKIEHPSQSEPTIPFAAHMGATFVHGAACTIHKAQGSQWDKVQIFAPDLYAASRAGRVESGIPLWKRLAYVAMTRAVDQMIWVQNYRLSPPKQILGTADLSAQPNDLALQLPNQDG